MACAVPTLEVDCSKDFTDDLLHNLYDMKAQAEMTDFTIKVNKVSIPCHSVVMSAASPYFKVLLRSAMTETTHRQVELNELHEDYLQKVVDYCYTGKITVHLDDVEHCIDIVEYFQLSLLKAKIEGFISDHLSIGNCISWFYQADKFNMQTLKNRSMSMMVSAFPEVSKQREFYQMPVHELLDYIQDVVKVVDTDTVLSACADWFKYNVGLRSDDFISLLQYLPLDMCSMYCKQRIRDSLNPAWPKHEEMQQALAVTSMTSVPSFEDFERVKSSFIVLGGFTEKNILNRKFWKVDLVKGTHECLGKMPNAAVKYGAGYCSTPQGIFVVGGSTGMNIHNPTNDCSMLSFSDMQWTSCSRVPKKTFDAVAKCVKNNVYVMGDYYTPEKVFCYNILSNKWSRGPDMPQKCIRPNIGSINDNIYVIFNTHSINSEFKKNGQGSLQCYDTRSSAWSKLCSLPASVTDTMNASCVTAGNSLFLVGGQGRLCARYSPSSDTWTTSLQRPSHIQEGCSALLLENGVIVVCGGRYPNSTFSDIIETYDIQKDTWTVLSMRLPIPLGLHFCTPMK